MTSPTHEESAILPIIDEFQEISAQVQDLDDNTKAAILKEFCKIAEIDLKNSISRKNNDVK